MGQDILYIVFALLVVCIIAFALSKHLSSLAVTEVGVALVFLLAVIGFVFLVKDHLPKPQTGQGNNSSDLSVADKSKLNGGIPAENYNITDTSIGWVHIGMTAEQINQYYSDLNKYKIVTHIVSWGTEDDNYVRVLNISGDTLIEAIFNNEREHVVSDIITSSPLFFTREEINAGLSIDGFLKKFENSENGIDLKMSDGIINSGYQYFCIFNRLHLVYIVTSNNNRLLYIKANTDSRIFSHDGYISFIKVCSQDMSHFNEALKDTSMGAVGSSPISTDSLLNDTINQSSGLYIVDDTILDTPLEPVKKPQSTVPNSLKLVIREDEMPLRNQPVFIFPHDPIPKGYRVVMKLHRNNIVEVDSIPVTKIDSKGHQNQWYHVYSVNKQKKQGYIAFDWTDDKIYRKYKGN